MRRGPCTGVEPLVADRVEQVMLAEGIAPGTRECHDAQPGRLRVDYVYPIARPRPIALEVTMLTLDWHRAGVHQADLLIERLSRAAETENLGAWLVTVRTNASRVMSLEPEILAVLEAAQVNRERLVAEEGDIRQGHYTSEDLLALGSDDARRRFAAEHKRLRDLGLVSFKPLP
jgi:hypothetical protein